MPRANAIEPPRLRPRALQDWVRAGLGDHDRLPAVALDTAAAETEAVLPWLAYRLHASSRLGDLPADRQRPVRLALQRFNALHLDCEDELQRLANAAARGLDWLVFKGHALARTLYPHPACRPTSDFDILVDPAQFDTARAWLAAAGYVPADPFAGTLWLGQQAWHRTEDGRRRFVVDLHWDYTNRMYFRGRLPFAAIWAEARTVACGRATLQVPGPVDDLLFACVHLAALDAGQPLRLGWLLDVYLLMAALDGAAIERFLARADRARAVEACLAFGTLAAGLGPTEAAAPVLQALGQAARPARWRQYRRTVRWRGWDLACYWARLGLRDKARLFGDLRRWLAQRSPDAPRRARLPVKPGPG